MTAEEKRENVKQAVANARLEGFEATEATKKTLEDYVAGKISPEEAQKQVCSRYGI